LHLEYDFPLVLLVVRSLLGFGSAVSSILEPGAPLVVLGAGRRQSAKLEVSFVEQPIAGEGRRRARP